MKNITKWLLGLLALIVVIYGSYLGVTKGIRGFKTRDISGIVFVVCVIIYFVFKTIKDVRKDSKKLENK